MKQKVAIARFFVILFSILLIGCKSASVESPNPTYKVTYNDNGSTGGLVPVDKAVYENGMTVSVLGRGTLEKIDYTFVGWNTEPDGTGTERFAGSTFTMGNAAVILYAQWTTNATYTVTYDGNTNTGGGVPTDDNRYKTGSLVTTFAAGTLRKTGSTFVGWNTRADGTGALYAASTQFTMGTSDVVLYAQWTTNPTFTVNYSDTNNAGGSVPVDANRYETGAVVITLGAGTLNRPGYTFVGWNTASDGTGVLHIPGNPFLMGAGNIILYAQWTTNPTFTVSYFGNGNTGGGVPTDNNSYESGAQALVLSSGLLEKPGCAFVGWNTAPDGSGANYDAGDTLVIDNADVLLYAQWELIPVFAVIYFDNGSTDGEVPVDATLYPTGSNVVVSGRGLLLKSGYTFEGWNTVADGSGVAYAPSDTFQMGLADVELYAQWQILPSYSIIYLGNGNTGGAVPDSQTKYVDTPLTIAANTGGLVRSGMSFVGWVTADGTSYDENEVYTDNATLELYARWDLGISLISVPAGTFHRDASETNTSTVSAFQIGQYEVTREQWVAVMGYDPSVTGRSTGITDPVQNFNWYAAITFCNKLSIAEGLIPVYTVEGVDFRTITFAELPGDVSMPVWDAAIVNYSANGYRLPTEMEWMWAAMGATDNRLKAFAGSDGANFIGDYVVFGSGTVEEGRTLLSTTSPVGSKLPNELQIYDLSGNVMEMTSCWNGAYPVGPLVDFPGLARDQVPYDAMSDPYRVVRGGNRMQEAYWCSVFYKYGRHPYDSLSILGIRVVRR